MQQVPKQHHDDGCLLAGLLRRHPSKLVSFAATAALFSSGERRLGYSFDRIGIYGSGGVVPGGFR